MAQRRKLSRSPRATQPAATHQTIIVIAQAGRPIVEEIEEFLQETGMLPTHFGRDAMGDPRFVSDMRKRRRELLPRTTNKLLAQMAFYREWQRFVDPTKEQIAIGGGGYGRNRRRPGALGEQSA